MKNLFLLPTDKPSRFVTSKENKKCYLYSIEEFKDIDKFIEYDSKSWDSQNIYITSDEDMEGDWYYNSFLNEISKMDILDYSNFRQKIILTTDQDLIKQGVQAIDDEFLVWFVKNTSCKWVEVKPLLSNNGRALFGYKIIIPKEEINQETFEDKLDRIVSKEPSKFLEESDKRMEAKAKLFRYSEEEVINFNLKYLQELGKHQSENGKWMNFKEWFELNKKKYNL